MRTFLVLLVLSLAVPGPAAAANASRTPTPQQLWNAFPLKPNGSGALPSPTARPVLRAQRRATADTQRHGTSFALLLAIAFALVVGAALAWAWLRWRAAPRASAVEPSPPPAASPPAAVRSGRPAAACAPAPARSSGAGPAAGCRGGRGAARGARQPVPGDGRSPVALRARVARARGTRARARTGGRAAVCLRTRRGRRPHSTAAAAQLDAELRAEGWTPLDPGERWAARAKTRWFDRRYVWTRPEPPPGTEGAG